MKATGIVRRIDDLGRVVIPKEIRRTLRIREGDPLLKGFGKTQMMHLAMRDIASRIENSYRILECTTKSQDFPVLETVYS